MSTPSVFMDQCFDDRSLVESILSSFFIIDYGFISAVNGDKTVNVTHAKKLKTLEGEDLPALETKNIEMLTIAGKGFSLKFDYQKGDKVLLLGLKDYVQKTAGVFTATENKAYVHYSRETIKALPLCTFENTAKVTIDIENGTMTLKALNVKINTTADVTVEAANVSVKTDADTKIEAANATVKASGNVNIEGSNVTVKGSQVKITGGTAEIGGTVAPTGQGALCGVPYCLYTGAPHVGKITSGT